MKVYAKDSTSTYYGSAVRHSNAALRRGVQKHEAYSFLDELHKLILTSTPTIRTIINVVLIPQTDNKLQEFKNANNLQTLLPTHPGYVNHVLSALPYLFDIEDQHIINLHPAFSAYLQDRSRSGDLCADLDAGRELVKGRLNLY